MVLRVAKPFSIGAGVPVASPWESWTPILVTLGRRVDDEARGSDETDEADATRDEKWSTSKAEGVDW